MPITSATSDDISELVVLINGAYRGDSSRKGWTTEADLLTGLRTDEAALLTMLENPQATILKYVVDDELLGCVYLEKQGSNLYLGMLTVSPEAQANGIGRQLLSAAEQMAIDRGCWAVIMTVLTARSELIAWYNRRGYQATGETKPFPNDHRFGIPTRPLTFIVLEKKLHPLVTDS